MVPSFTLGFRRFSTSATVSFVKFSLCYTFLLLAFVALTRTSSITLNKSDKSGRPCLGPDLRGRVLSVFILNVIFTAPFSINAFCQVAVTSYS